MQINFSQIRKSVVKDNYYNPTLTKITKPLYLTSLNINQLLSLSYYLDLYLIDVVKNWDFEKLYLRKKKNKIVLDGENIAKPIYICEAKDLEL